MKNLKLSEGRQIIVNKFQRGLVLLMLSAGLLGSLGTAFALEPGNIRYGRIEIHPSFGFETKYNDNVFLEADQAFFNGTQEGASDDMIFSNTPGVAFKLDRQKGDFFGFEMNYTGVDEHFVTLTQQNKFNHYFGGNMTFAGPGGRSQLTVTGDYHDTQLPSSSEFASNFNPILSRVYTNVRADFDWTSSRRFSGNVFVGRDSQNFDLAALSFQDTEDVTTGMDMFYQLTGVTSLGLKYDYRRLDYDAPGTVNSDSDTHSIVAAARWKPSAIVSGEVSLGWSDRSYDRFFGQDRDDWVYGLALNYEPTSRTRVIFAGNRSIQDSSFGIIQAFVSTSFGVTWHQKVWKNSARK